MLELLMPLILKPILVIIWKCVLKSQLNVGTVMIAIDPVTLSQNIVNDADTCFDMQPSFFLAQYIEQVYTLCGCLSDPGAYLVQAWKNGIAEPWAGQSNWSSCLDPHQRHISAWRLPLPSDTVSHNSKRFLRAVSSSGDDGGGRIGTSGGSELPGVRLPAIFVSTLILAQSGAGSGAERYPAFHLSTKVTGEKCGLECIIAAQVYLGHHKQETRTDFTKLLQFPSCSPAAPLSKNY